MMASELATSPCLWMCWILPVKVQSPQMYLPVPAKMSRCRLIGSFHSRLATLAVSLTDPGATPVTRLPFFCQTLRKLPVA